MQIPLIILTGESNSVGFGLNSLATPIEAAVNTNLKILSSSSFLNIIFTSGGTHSFELALSSAIPSTIPFAYLAKYGVGGTRISDWAPGTAIKNNLIAVINQAKSLLVGVDYKPFIWYTQGINDASQSTDVNLWKTATKAHLDSLRVLLPKAPIIATQLTPSYTSYSNAIVELQSEYPDFYAISTDGASQLVGNSGIDPNHWDYQGLKVIGGRMVAKTKLLLSNRGSQSELSFGFKNSYFPNYFYQNAYLPSRLKKLQRK